MSMHPAAVGHFAPIGTYLDTAAYGLPPRATVAAMTGAIEQWQAGRGRWQVDWDPAGEDSRTLLASIIGTSPADVALVPAVSVGVGIAASLLTPGDVVVVPEDEFASLLLPLVAAAELRGARVRRVPFGDLAGALSASTALVATSHVRSNGGGLMALDTLMAAADATATPVLLDATHSAGVLPIEMARRGIDVVVAAGYKHLLCPRGRGESRHCAPPGAPRQTPTATTSAAVSTNSLPAGLDSMSRSRGSRGSVLVRPSRCWTGCLRASENVGA